MRWLVGDIQGCARELDDLLVRVRFDPGRDELWSAGDLVNRGPDSLATLRLWRDVAGRAVIGNHDVYAIRARRGLAKRKGDTLAALFEAPDADELLAELHELPVLVFLAAPQGARDVWLIHAGLDPRWGELEPVAARVNNAPRDDDWLVSDDVSFATRVRCCTAEGLVCRFSGPPQDCPGPYRPWDSFYRGPTLVVHGHWARRGHYRTQRTIGLDSGCVYGGELTAWCQEDDRIVQVPSRESGRGPSRVDLGGAAD